MLSNEFPFAVKKERERNSLRLLIFYASLYLSVPVKKAYPLILQNKPF